jgi:photosystem II stability/assembly factor-like uncharacterized protein
MARPKHGPGPARALAWGLIGAALLAGCDNEVAVTLENLWHEVDGVFVYAVVDGKTQEGARIPRRGGINALGKLRLRLPAPRAAYTGEGEIIFRFEAEDASGCTTGTTEQPINLRDGIPSSVSLPMTRAERATCRVAIRVRGQGTVDGGPDGIPSAPSCGPFCYVRFPSDQPLTLAARPGAGAHFSGWGGDCAGQSRAGRCPLALGAPRAVEAQFDQGLCTHASFCWENPLPQGNSLLGVWGPAQGQTFFAVGAAGTLVQETPAGLLAHRPAAAAGVDLFGVAGTGQDDVWVVGQAGLVLHYDGQQWSDLRLADPRLGPRSLYGVSTHQRGAGWAVGDGSAIYQLAAGTWNPSRIDPNDGLSPLLLRVASTPTRAFAVGGGGTIQDFKDTWSPSPRPACDKNVTLNGLWLADPLVWAVGGSFVLRYQDRMCQMPLETVTLLPEDRGSLLSIAGISGRDREPTWVVGQGGLVLRRAAGAWRALPRAERPTTLSLHEVIGQLTPRGPRYVAVGQGGVIVQGDDQALRPAPVVLSRATLNAVAGPDPGALFAVGEQGTILRYDGTSWREESTPDDRPREQRATLRGAYADAAQVVVVGDKGTIFAMDLTQGADARFQLLDGPRSMRLNAVTALGGMLFVADAGGSVWCSPDRGGTWVERSLGVLPFHALWADPDKGLVFVAGARQSMGSSNLFSIEVQGRCALLAQLERTDSDATLYALSALGGVLHAAGDGLIARRKTDGSRVWEVVLDRPSDAFRALAAGVPSGVIWAAGRNTLYRGDAGGFKQVPAITRDAILGAWRQAPDHLVLVGEGGAIVRFAP